MSRFSENGIKIIMGIGGRGRRIGRGCLMGVVFWLRMIMCILVGLTMENGLAIEYLSPGMATWSSKASLTTKKTATEQFSSAVTTVVTNVTPNAGKRTSD